MDNTTTDKIINHLRHGTLLSVILNTIGKQLKPIKYRWGIFKRDVLNKIRYGYNAPLHQELIWVNPAEITCFVDKYEIERVTDGLNRSEASGVVIDWDEIEVLKPLAEEIKINMCLKHWGEGVSWDELGAIDFTLQNSKRYQGSSRVVVKKRYDYIDEVFRQVKSEGQLKTRKEINPDNFREKDGVLVHIGKDGSPYFGGGGYHRLAMARLLEFDLIPACIGVVDKRAIAQLGKYRKRSSNR